MEKLSKYIKDKICEEHIVKVNIPESQFSTFDEFLDMNDKTIETVTEKEIDQFDRLVFNVIYERNKQYLWFIDEMLNSNSAKNLAEVLKEVFGDYVVDYEISKDSKIFANGASMFDIYVKDGVVDDSTEFSNKNDKYHKYFSPKLKLKEFESIIQSHQYFITLVYKVEDYFCISCEPKFTEKVNTSGDKYGYHVIYTGEKKDVSFGSENFNKILKVGLRPQVGVVPNGDALVSQERLNMEYR